MKRVLAIAIMLLVISSTCLFARVWFAPYSASFGADLSRTDIYTGLAGKIPSDLPAHMPDTGPGYTRETMVALLGVTESSSDTIVTVTFDNSNGWKYQSISQPDATRNFEIYLVYRQRYEKWVTKWHNPEWDDWDSYNYGEKTGTYDKTVEIIHMSQDFETITFPKTDRTLCVDGNGFGETQFDRNGNPYVGDDALDLLKSTEVLIGCWVDIILCLPKQENITPANDYYASLDVNVSGGASGTFHCEFTGYYDIVPDYVQNSGDVLFNVVPNANASSINLSTANDLIAPDGPGLEIGRYSYSTTNPYDSQTYENTYYMFASSSPSAVSNNDGQFKLRLQGTDESISNDSIEIPFSIGLVTDGHEIASGGYEEGYYKWFNGTTDMSSSVESMKKSLGGGKEQIVGSGTIYIYYDNGSVLFRLNYDNLASTPDGQQINPIDKLIAGNYTSKIYFHVISEL